VWGGGGGGGGAVGAAVESTGGPPTLTLESAAAAGVADVAPLVPSGSPSTLRPSPPRLTSLRTVCVFAWAKFAERTTLSGEPSRSSDRFSRAPTELGLE
jgi:hypothetical protein